MTKAIQPKLFIETTIVWRNYHALYVDNQCCVRAIWNRLLFFLFSRCGWFLGKAVDQNHKITWKDETDAISAVTQTRNAFFARLQKAPSERTPDFVALEAAADNYIKALEKRVDQLARFNLSPKVKQLNIQGFKSETLEPFHTFCGRYATKAFPELYAGLLPTIDKLEQSIRALFEKLRKVYPGSILKSSPSIQPKKTVHFADEAPENPTPAVPPPLTPDQCASTLLCLGQRLKKQTVARIKQNIITTYLKEGNSKAIQEQTHLLFTALPDLVASSETLSSLTEASYIAIADIIEAIRNNPTSTYIHASLLKLWLQLAISLQLCNTSQFLEEFPVQVANMHAYNPEFFQQRGGFEALRNYAQMMRETYLCVHPTADAADTNGYAKRQVAYFLSLCKGTDWEPYAQSAAVAQHLKTNPPPSDPIWQTVEIGRHIHHFAKPESEEAQAFLTYVLSAPQPLN